LNDRKDSNDLNNNDENDVIIHNNMLYENTKVKTNESEFNLKQHQPDLHPTKLIHHMHASILPYSNFRDFDTQYSWDYTDNLVNKLISGKLEANVSNLNNITTNK
jgi:hypothetical protein